MTKLLFLIILSLVFTSNCKKNEETPTSSGNVSSQVVANLTQVSTGFTPASLTSTTASSVTQKADPCQGVSDWAVCQSNLIREYLVIGRSTVDTISQFVGAVGTALGNIPDGNAGTSEDGKVSWSKTDANNWSLLVRGANSAPHLHVSISNSVYSLKVDGTVDETEPSSFKAEASVTYTDANTWDVDVFFHKDESSCDATDVGAPSKVNIKLSKANGLWTGKSMLYMPRWEKPNTSVTCSTTAGTYEAVLYTDFVGNDTSTKASLYITGGSVSNFLTTPANHELIDICSNLSGTCDVSGGPTAAGLTQAAYGNPMCTTGPGTSPTWNNACTANATVNSASYSDATKWLEPATLKAKSVTLPTSL